MDKVNKCLSLPEKSDYPHNLALLHNTQQSDLYRQLVESSASAYFETNFITRYFFQKRFQLALKLIPRYRKTPAILDAGCGIGFFLPALTQFSQNIWAIDYAQYSLTYAKFMCKKRRLKSVHFKKVNLIDSLPFPDKTFDLIICLSVLEHIKSLERVAKSFKRVLKKDGFLIAGYPNEDNLIFKVLHDVEKRLLRPRVFAALEGTRQIHVSKAHEISKVLARFFFVEKTTNINLLPGMSFYILQKYRLR